MRTGDLEKKIERRSLSELYRRSPRLTSWLAVDIYIKPYFKENDLLELEYCSYHDSDRRKNRIHISIRIKDIPKLVERKEIESIELHEILF